jgi:hypothetical protein
MKYPDWNEPPDNAPAADVAEPEAAGPDEGVPDAAVTPKRAGTPAWAWALMGVLALAIVAGGVWLAYSNGIDAGRRIAAPSSETTAAQVAQVITVTVAPIEPPDAGTVDPGSGETVVIEEPEPPKSDPPGGTGGSSGTKGYDLSLVKPLDLQPVAPKVPTTWTKVFDYSNTGPWEMPNPPGIVFKAGYLRMTVLGTDNANNSGYVQLRRVDGGASLPNYGILYDWPGGTGNVVYKVTDPVLVEAGTYQVRASIHGPWTIVIEK